MREATSDVDIWAKLGGYMVQSMRFVDDKAVVASSKKGLHEQMDNMVTKVYGIKKINVKKT